MEDIANPSVAVVELSIVVPMRNESASIEPFFNRLLAVIERIGVSYEIICVDDGSTDDTLPRLLALHGKNAAIKILSFSRNFGKDIALTAGIDNALGRAVIPIDADLQDPPELIDAMVVKWRSGYDVVYGKRISRAGETLAKRATAGMFYRAMQRLTDVAMPSDTGDFRLMDRRVVDALRRLPERARFMKGLFAWVGFRQVEIPYNREIRQGGETKWSYWRLWNFAIDGITSFSSIPLKIWSYVGLAISLLAFAYASFLALRTIIRGIDVPGYASLMVVVLFLGGVQLITLGVIGEYLARVYNEVKARPLYLISKRFGFDRKR